jgi:membrane fusion protein, multidrug efflux system
MSTELESEIAKREAAERTAREAIAQAASERVAREHAEKLAQEALSAVSTERTARQAAEKLAQDASAKAASVIRAHETAEALAMEAMAKGTAALKAPSTTQVPAKAAEAVTPQTTQASGKVPITSNWIVPLIIFASAGILFFFISGLWTTWESSNSVRTDDAYVRADIAPLSTKVTAVVRQVEVNDFEKVKAGQVLVELKNDEFKARVEQAKQAIRQAEIKLSDMKQRKEQQDAKVAESQSNVETSRTSIKQVDDSIMTAQATIEEAKAGIEAAQAAILQSKASTRAASADVTRTSSERGRQEALLADESSTKANVEQIVDENDRALANLDAQNASHAKAQAELMAKHAQLRRAIQQLSTSQIEKEKSLLTVRSREAELKAQQKQRELLNGEEQQLASEVASKKAGLISAQVDLDYTIVRAPADGIVGELKVKPGQLVSAGTQVITLISATPWVVANYRETQLRHVRDGDLAEVTIDAIPGKQLKGHVDKLAPASGAQFSLLPPDNASGNFTKITQRIQVKICFDESADKLTDIRPGMSAITIIKPGNRH